MVGDKVLTWFIWGWCVLVVLANLAAVIGFFVAAPSLKAGWIQVEEIYSPSNVTNLLAEIAVLSPAIAAAYWRDKRRVSKKAG